MCQVLGNRNQFAVDFPAVLIKSIEQNLSQSVGIVQNLRHILRLCSHFYYALRHLHLQTFVDYCLTGMAIASHR